MELRYDEGTMARLRQWRETDSTLYEATEKQLMSIKADPRSYGIDGSPNVPRLVSYSVRGRDDEYVITWEVGAEAVFIGDVCSVAEMQQRVRLRGTGHK